MRLTINGESRDIPDGYTVSELLDSCNLKPQMVVVELNEGIVRRDQYPTTALHDSDSLEIVQMMAGG